MQKEIYKKVYYRISAGYVWGKGMEEKDRTLFNNEMVKILSSLGFTIDIPEDKHYCIKVFRGKENLYCHPQSLSGYIKEINMKTIEEKIKGAKTFTFNKTDVFDTAFDYSEKEFIEELDKSDITAKILDGFKTKRRNLYKDGRMLYSIKSGIPYFKPSDLEKIETRYISDRFESLIKAGEIKKSINKHQDNIYRTITNKEKAK